MRVSISKFREVVDEIKDPFHSYAIKLAYETGARANELCSIDHPGYHTPRIGKSGKEIKHTRAVGPTKANVGMDVYNKVPILTIDLLVLKRKERVGESPFFRTCGLPCSEEYDPWVLELAQSIKALPTDAPLLNLDAWNLNAIFKKYDLYNLVREDKGRPPGDVKKVENPLRHFRRDHLRRYYHFTPSDVAGYVGSKLSSLWGSAGSEDSYQSPYWTDWIEKLLKPLPNEILQQIV